jgi:hypothetical protein
MAPVRARRTTMSLLGLALAVSLVMTIQGDGRSPEPEDATAPSTTSVTTQVTAVTGDLPSGVTLREPDGSYPAGLPNDPMFFPLGVWLETVLSPDDVVQDKSFGLNLYAALAHDDLTDLDAIETGGMHLLAQADEWAGDSRANHAAVDGWLVYDEADLMYGPGWHEWSGTAGWNTCFPIQDEGGQCGYTVMEEFESRVPGGALRYANYGLGVLHFESDAEAEVFVNHGFQDVVSADDYAFTRPDIDDEDRRGAFYGWIIDRLQSLDRRDGERQPVWAFVEVGHPFTEDDAPTITAPQVRSAVWHSIIAGARGIIYFNHSFGGSCSTFSVLRARCDPKMTPAVTALNGQITELAPVLNGPFADGYVTAEGPAEVMAKLGPDGAWYVFAGANTLGSAGGDVTFTIAAGRTVEVLDEDQNLAVSDGRFVDTFTDGNAIHIYRIT